ncbi:MAG: hypothetical protein C0594_05875 [Marinilabiliales bacterium]|nr:MAG: hypothetical protein C0594_05875 [Marinilabiliales bacterium]
MRIAKNIFVWLIALGYFIASIALVSADKEDKICNTIDFSINDTTGCYFVERTDILQLLEQRNLKTIGQPFTRINKAQIEQAVINHPSVKNAQVYIENDSTLAIEVVQRNPIVRVFNYNGESYYIDKEGYVMPLSENYTAHVPVVSGKINEPYGRFVGWKIDEYESRNELGRTTILDDVYLLATFLINNYFWQSQIEQLFVNVEGEFEMVPKVGANIIEFGDASELEEKFNKLELLYERGFRRVGWNKYSRINVKYKNQVVCTKR